MAAGRVVVVRAATAALAAIVGIGLFAVLAPDRADASGPVAQVHVHAQAYEGPRGTILASLRGRCAPGYEVADLVLDFSQGAVTTPSVLGQPFRCDGRWHEQRVTSLEAFEPGHATLTARLSVVRVSTGDPGPQAVDTQDLYVRPAAKVVLPRTVHLEPDGAITAVVRARCDTPWVLQDFLVEATQGDGVGAPFGSTLADLVCDGKVRPVTVRIAPVAAPFHRGHLRLDGVISLLDPDSFDPVTSAGATRTVRVR
jgi:hypothetical protein